jgi:hypothetical protein
MYKRGKNITRKKPETIKNNQKPKSEKKLIACEKKKQPASFTRTKIATQIYIDIYIHLFLGIFGFFVL